MRDRTKDVLEELLDPENWKPNFSRIANKLDMPVSTVFDNVQFILYNELVSFRTDVKLKVGRRKNDSKRDSAK